MNSPNCSRPGREETSVRWIGSLLSFILRSVIPGSSGRGYKRLGSHVTGESFAGTIPSPIPRPERSNAVRSLGISALQGGEVQEELHRVVVAPASAGNSFIVYR